MTDETRNDASDENTPDAKVDNLDAESQRTIRERVTQLAFGGDPARFDEFVSVLSDATPDGVEVMDVLAKH